MPSAAARRLYEDQIPSFMSVFDLGAADTAMDDQGAVTVVDPKAINLTNFSASNYNAKLPSLAPPPHPTSSQQKPSFLQHASAAVVGAGPHTLPCDPSHRHHDSTSTQASESADSSPTTTASCTDSSSLSDPSPSSSPDSPINLVPLAALPGPSFGSLSSMSRGLASLSVGESPVGQGRPMTSPSPRRARNMKGLSIQPPFVSPTLSSTLVSEPSSPSFIKPQIPAMKRKPSQLSLKTSTHDLVKSTTLEMPQSPSLALPPILQRRALKHSTSSPHMLSSLKSATFGPAGGMTFRTVLERNESGLSEFLRPSRPSGPVGFDSTILEEESPIRTQIANRAAFEFEPFHDQENNEDQKTPGYPDGPIAIYGDNIFLYLEPSAEEAAQFDVVINVAREVKNPFKALAGSGNNEAPILDAHQEQMPEPLSKLVPNPGFSMEAQMEQALRRQQQQQQQQQQQHQALGMQHIPEDEPISSGSPMTFEPTSVDVPVGDAAAELIDMSNVASATPPRPPTLSLAPHGAAIVSEPAQEDSTPTTPKASLPFKEPEYIHVPWDHNTDIGEDLMTLCQTIEKRTSEGKKVLIHCQQGASRSASLIIAYGMYQNPDLSVNDAYYAAQAKSKWISPNMRLMYCLQDFQKQMTQKKMPPSSTFRPRSGRSPTKLHRATLSVDAITVSPKEPLSAPLPTEDADGSPGTHSPKRSPLRPRGISTPSSREAISPGPSSAPSSFSWSEKEDDNDPYKFGRFNLDLPTTNSRSLQSKLLLPEPGSDRASAFGKPMAGSMRPPPSPGFPAHGFGEFPSSIRSNPAALSGFPLLSPGSPPARRSSSGGLDSVLSKSMEASNIDAHETVDAAKGANSGVHEQTILIRPAFPVDMEEPLMSPRAETMTKNPLHEPFADVAGMRFIEVPPTPSEGLFSPRETMFPRDPFFPFGRPTQMTDPRSPPTVGETPIVRSIDELI
ncbi:protein-tyrosine phosphatase [Niveomyces insectorum RCEF 264]|uniref:protein-tyrosine-phosphatase n=1 Tax=Niveomyces insectorum RCEF 264 TaxID=1081102 RepID=A0A167RGE4_9HYPO|nr:protein-tyrosine phosphatase [Niveomyces insectorum RCEF 264]